MIQVLQQALLSWYDLHARVLPWRTAKAGSRAAYHVWLSEILLQQTQVARGTVYFQSFLTAFPTIQDLAAAPLEAVLKLWEGAGYYARARNLHRAAQIMVETGLPHSSAAWLELPGVGRYTAAAIASLSANETVAAVDGNVRRVLARLHNNPSPSDTWLWETAQVLLEPTRAGAWNEALIELGALVCTPKKPRCLECPISGFCLAFKAQTVNFVPAPKPRAKVQLVQAVALLLHFQQQVLLELRPKNGLLGGLYGVPLEPIQTTALAALERLCERYTLSVQPIYLGRVSHTMTHRQFEIQVFALKSNQTGLVFPTTRAIANLDRKILVLLEQGLFITPT
jgi:A/G-specific adenine glycosylase